MRTNQAAHDDKAPLGVVDGLLEEMCLERGDTGGKVIFARARLARKHEQRPDQIVEEKVWQLRELLRGLEMDRGPLPLERVTLISSRTIVSHRG